MTPMRVAKRLEEIATEVKISKLIRLGTNLNLA
jgi:hypothetical protein